MKNDLNHQEHILKMKVLNRISEKSPSFSLPKQISPGTSRFFEKSFREYEDALMNRAYLEITNQQVPDEYKIILPYIEEIQEILVYRSPFQLDDRLWNNSLMLDDKKQLIIDIEDYEE